MAKKIITQRTRIKADVVCEFMAPAKKSSKVVIVCDGMPTVPSKKTILEYWAKKGYWAFHPRYRGSWESGGKFLAQSPAQDVLDVLDGLGKGFRNAFTGEVVKLKPSKVILFGGSYGAVPALLASTDKRISKVVLFCPLVDWSSPSKDEPLGWLLKFVKEAFGNGYRIDVKNWNELESGKIFNPINIANKVRGKNILLIHAIDDGSVNINSVREFAAISGSRLIILPKGGHLSSSLLLEPKFSKIINNFIK